MSAHIFHTSSRCPVCHRPHTMQPHQLLTGLLTCQHCRERFVISWSGHYVRDPFNFKEPISRRMLRRESRPLARLRRDFAVSAYPLVLTALASALLIALFSVFLPMQTPEAGVSEPTGNPTTDVRETN